MAEWWDDPEIQAALQILDLKGVTAVEMASAWRRLERRKEPHDA